MEFKKLSCRQELRSKCLYGKRESPGVQNQKARLVQGIE